MTQQLIAHDRPGEVYDVAWLPGSTDIFVSVGADGSLRAFDFRSLEHSTILYETPAPKNVPLPSLSLATARPPTSPSKNLFQSSGFKLHVYFSHGWCRCSNSGYA